MVNERALEVTSCASPHQDQEHASHLAAASMPNSSYM